MQENIYRELTKHDTLKYIFFILLTIVILLLNGFYILPLSATLYFLVILLVLYILISWHSRTTAYRCRNCEHEFEIGFWQDLFSAHLPTRKYLKCPSCQTKTWTTVLIKISRRY